MADADLIRRYNERMRITNAAEEASDLAESVDASRDDFRGRVRYASAATNGWVGGIRGPFSGNKTRSFLTTWQDPSYVNHTEIRRAMRSAWVDSSETRALINRLVENVINSGLTPEPKPAYDLVAPEWDTEQRNRWEREVAQQFDLWARSTDASANRKHTFYQLQARVLEDILIDGEQLSVLRYRTRLDQINPVTIQRYDPSQLVNPMTAGEMEAAQNRGHLVRHGVEMTSDGEPVAYYFANREAGETVRIPARGPRSGRLFVLHPMTPLFPGHVRGTSVLAPIVHELSKITDYSTAEISAAVLNASIAAWVKPSDEADSSRPLAGVKRKDSAEIVQDTNATEPPAYGEIDRPGIFVQNLRAGEELQSYNTQRPNVNFQQFVDSIMKNVSASISVPVEVLRMSFNQNYSASRASLLLFWNKVRQWRADVQAWFLDPIYTQWLSEEVAAGNIRAPGFNSVRGRRAWSRCNWVGINHPSIDPLKEANAAAVRISEGLTTRDREAAAYNRSSFRENVAELEGENEELARANAPIETVQMELPLDEEGEE